MPPIGGIGVKPHSLSICNRPKLAYGIDCSGVRGTEDAHDTQWPYATLVILRNRRLERIQPHSESSVCRQGAQRGSTQPYGVDSFVYRNMPFFRRVNCPAFLDPFVLDLVARNAVPC